MYGNKRVRIGWLCLISLVCALRLQAKVESQPLLNAAPSAWSAPSGTPEAAFTENGIVFNCPFTEDRERFYWDLKLDRNFADHDGLRVGFQFENPDTFRAVTLHFESGAGWYAATLPVADTFQTLFIPFDTFEPQGEPAGWDTITRFRVSPWKSDSSTGRFVLTESRVERATFLLVEPDRADFPSVEEHRYATGIAEALSDRLWDVGLPVTRLSDVEAADADLNRYDVVVFPLNPRISPALADALGSFVSGGGKLAVFYSGSPELADLAGFKPPRYLSTPRKNSWSVFLFEDDSWNGPEKVEQPGTDNLMVVPVSGDARVLARWTDGYGRRQREPAVLMSEHALWFTSVLTPGNEEEKNKLLAFALDRLRPKSGIAQAAVSTAYARARARPMQPWFRFLAERDTDGHLENQVERVEALLEKGDAAAAWSAVDSFARDIDRRTAQSVVLSRSGMRGIWDHTGDGLTQGDWDDTFSLLASANLTDYFGYVARNAPVSSRMIAAAGAAGIGIHAWHICFQLYGVSPVQVRRYEREGRLQIHQNGEVLSWLCPSNERNRKMELRRLSQLAETAGLRGLHLDYPRWPDGVFCRCSNCEEAYTRHAGHSVDWPADVMEDSERAAFLEWRTGVITSFIETVSRQIRAQRPGLRLSAAVWPGYPEVIHRLGQDWGEWMDRGLLDFVVPMNYTGSSKKFKEWVQHQTTVIPDPDKLVAGIGFRSSESRLTPAQMLDQLRISEAAGTAGYVLFQLNPAFQSEAVPVLQVLYERGN